MSDNILKQNDLNDFVLHYLQSKMIWMEPIKVYLGIAYPNPHGTHLKYCHNSKHTSFACFSGQCIIFNREGKQKVSPYKY